MSDSTEKQIEEAFQIVGCYERGLIEKMAAEIIERKEDFDSPFVGGAEQLVDKYYHLLACVCRVRSGLYGHLPRAQNRRRSDDRRPLEKDEFRCFRCRAIISDSVEACPECGWTWG